MTDPVVETQLLLPRLRRETVARPRLAHALDRASDAPVTVVSAPAGFGKTTLISTWLHAWLTERPAADAGTEGSRSAAWVSLTGRDRNPASFWTYTLSAVRSEERRVGK